MTHPTATRERLTAHLKEVTADLRAATEPEEARHHLTRLTRPEGTPWRDYREALHASSPLPEPLEDALEELMEHATELILTNTAHHPNNHGLQTLNDLYKIALDLLQPTESTREPTPEPQQPDRTQALAEAWLRGDAPNHEMLELCRLLLGQERYDQINSEQETKQPQQPTQPPICRICTEPSRFILLDTQTQQTLLGYCNNHGATLTQFLEASILTATQAHSPETKKAQDAKQPR